MITSSYKKTKTNKNKTKNKTKTKTKRQIGSGIIYKTPSRYTNIRYTKSKTEFKTDLKCLICRGDVFKMRTMKLSTQKKAIIFSIAGVVGNIFNNKFRFFTCTNCGKVEVYSNNITVVENSAS